MATSPVYCTHRDLEDVFPQIENYDNKEQIFGWEDMTIGSTTFYIAPSCGLITQLYYNGKLLPAPDYTSGTTSIGTMTHTLTNPATDVGLFFTGGATNADNLDRFDDGLLMVGDEIIGITTATDVGSWDVLNFTESQRGLLGTIAKDHDVGESVKIIFSHKHQDESYKVSQEYWAYNEDLDMCFLYTGTNPNDNLVENGENYHTLITRYIKNASRYLDSRIDANLPRDQFKDKEGNYDYIIVRTTALIAAYFLIRAKEPESILAEELFEEINFNIEQLNSGATRLSGNVTGDSSKGVVREVLAPQNSNGLHIVDTRGNYNGTYDLIKVKVTTGGALGTAKFDVYTAGTDSLKSSKTIEDKIISGKYQTIGGGLEIRFAGKDSSSVATANDEWEIEVWGQAESLDDNIGNVRSVKLTRGNYTRRRKSGKFLTDYI